MAFQKNFVVKNGIEVNDNLIFADKNKNTVGIGTTLTPEKLQVNGGIGATSIVVTGVGTFPVLKSPNALIGNGYINVGIVTSIAGTGLTFTTGNLNTLNATTGNIVTGVVTTLSGSTATYTNVNSTVLNSGTVLTPNLFAVSGVVTSIRGSSISISGISTFGSISIGSTQIVNSSRQLQNITSLDSTTTAAVEAAITSAPKTFTNLTVTGISTLGRVRVSTGIVTATSGIVTYYGDGSKLNLTGNPYLIGNIGVRTEGSVVGYGVSFFDFRGAGVSTTFYNSSVGIATIFFDGGGGSGTIGIGTSFPANSLNGDLFFNINYGRIFVYYNEVALGIGSTAVWIDAAPFNTGETAALPGTGFTMGSANAPSAYFDGYPTTGWFSPTGGQFTVVSFGSSILNVNPSGVRVTGIASASLFSGTFSGGFIGTSAFISSATSGDLVRITQLGNGNALVVEDNTSPDSTPFVVTGIGSVGIGTSAPINLLDVHGTIRVARQDSVLDGGEIVFARASDNTNAWALDVFGSGPNPAFRIVDSTQSATRVHINSSGHVGLGSTATSRLHVFGDAIVTGVVTCTDVNSTSDINLKENIQTVDNALNIVNDLRGVKFEWKENHRPSYGVIAQELEKVLPELVTDTDPKTVNYNGIIGVLIEAVKELSAEVEELRMKIDNK